MWRKKDSIKTRGGPRTPPRATMREILDLEDNAYLFWKTFDCLLRAAASRRPPSPCVSTSFLSDGKRQVCHGALTPRRFVPAPHQDVAQGAAAPPAEARPPGANSNARDANRPKTPTAGTCTATPSSRATTWARTGPGTGACASACGRRRRPWPTTRGRRGSRSATSSSAWSSRAWRRSSSGPWTGASSSSRSARRRSGSRRRRRARSTG